MLGSLKIKNGCRAFIEKQNLNNFFLDAIEFRPTIETKMSAGPDSEGVSFAI